MKAGPSGADGCASAPEQLNPDGCDSQATFIDFSSIYVAVETRRSGSWLDTRRIPGSKPSEPGTMIKERTIPPLMAEAKRAGQKTRRLRQNFLRFDLFQCLDLR